MIETIRKPFRHGKTEDQKAATVAWIRKHEPHRVLFSNADQQDLIALLMSHVEEITVICTAAQFRDFAPPFGLRNVEMLVADPAMIDKVRQPRMFVRYDMVINYRAPTLGGPDIPDEVMMKFVAHNGHLCSIEHDRAGWQIGFSAQSITEKQ